MHCEGMTALTSFEVFDIHLHSVALPYFHIELTMTLKAIAKTQLHWL